MSGSRVEPPLAGFFLIYPVLPKQTGDNSSHPVSKRENRLFNSDLPHGKLIVSCVEIQVVIEPQI